MRKYRVLFLKAIGNANNNKFFLKLSPSTSSSAAAHDVVVVVDWEIIIIMMIEFHDTKVFFFNFIKHNPYEKLECIPYS